MDCGSYNYGKENETHMVDSESALKSQQKIATKKPEIPPSSAPSQIHHLLPFPEWPHLFSPIDTKI